MITTTDLTGRTILVAGGTGAVGEGIVRAYLAAGATVVVPTRTEGRAAEFRAVLGDATTADLHLFAHDYTTFAGAEELADQMMTRFGRIDGVVAAIGGWWSSKPLVAIDEADWQSAFVDLATAHMAVLRATLPRLSAQGAYVLVLGASAVTPIPGSGLVSAEQAALLMIHQVLLAEGVRRAFALVLGPVRTRVQDGEPTWVSADQVGALAAALAGAPSVAGREYRLLDSAAAQGAISLAEGEDQTQVSAR